MTPAGRRRAAAATATGLIGLMILAQAGQRIPKAAGRPFDLSAIPNAPAYRTDVPKGPAFFGNEAAALARSLVRINMTLGTRLRTDPRLSRLALWIHERLGSGSAIPEQSVLDAVTRRLGLAEPLPHLLVTHAPDASQLAGVVSSRMIKLSDIAGYSHIGGLAERETGGITVVIALSRRAIDMRPVPRRLEIPGRIVLEGRMTGPYVRPELAHTLPGGRTVIEPLGRGPDFRRAVRLAQVGVHRLEILGEGPGGPTVLANIPVFVGVPVDETIEPAGPPPAAARPDDPRDQLLALINADRMQAGLEALVPDGELDEVARRHSEDMRANGFVAHVSPTAGTTAERLARAELRTDLSAENVGKGYGMEEIHRGFMDSPGHRAAVLLAGATHVGLGLAPEVEHDRTTYYVTELFIRRIPTLGPDALQGYGKVLNGFRQALRLRRLDEDPALSEIADAAARAYLADPALTQEETLAGLRTRLAKAHQNARRIYMVFGIVGSLADGAKRAAADPRAEKARRVGIGIAQGTRPGMIPNSIVLVLIYSE